MWSKNEWAWRVTHKIAQNKTTPPPPPHHQHPHHHHHATTTPTRQDLNLSVDDELESEESYDPDAPHCYASHDDADPTNKAAISRQERRAAAAAAAAAANAAGGAGGGAVAAAPPGRGAAAGGSPPGVQRSKLIIVMVGLPGRGKTFLCNKRARLSLAAVGGRGGVADGVEPRL